MFSKTRIVLPKEGDLLFKGQHNGGFVIFAGLFFVAFLISDIGDFNKWVTLVTLSLTIISVIMVLVVGDINFYKVFYFSDKLVIQSSHRHKENKFDIPFYKIESFYNDEDVVKLTFTRETMYLLEDGLKLNKHYKKSKIEVVDFLNQKVKEAHQTQESIDSETFSIQKLAREMEERYGAR